jgi:excisionase family DNA binding protein
MSNQPNANGCLSPKELAKFLGIDLGNAYSLIRSTGFPSLRIGRRWITPRENLDRWLAEQAAQKNNAAG